MTNGFKLKRSLSNRAVWAEFRITVVSIKLFYGCDRKNNFSTLNYYFKKKKIVLEILYSKR